MNIFAQKSLFGTWSCCAPACSCVVCHIYACFDAFPLLLGVLTSRELVFAILDGIPVLLWKWEFTSFLALFLCASSAVVFRESRRCPFF